MNHARDAVADLLLTFAAVPPVALETATVELLPVPYEGTFSYNGGASRGPEALLNASCYLELFDEDLQQESWQAGFYTHSLLLPDHSGPEAMIGRVRLKVEDILARKRFFAIIGGEHSITLGTVQALKKHHPRPFTVLQLDAHMDLRDRYHYTSFSHATVMRRIFEEDVPFVSVGVRSLSREEWDFIHEKGLENRIFWAKDLVGVGNDRWMDAVIDLLEGDVFITIDLDVLDPSIFPATGAPEPGGMDYYSLLRFLSRLFEKRQIIGCDLVEFAPIAGQVASDFLAAKLLYKIMGLAVRPLLR
ncbi:agmatinase [Magnetococcales bacterium HHB-1]